MKKASYIFIADIGFINYSSVWSSSTVRNFATRSSKPLNNDFDSEFLNEANFLNDDYQFLEKSILPTFHFQTSLPRLKIPSLAHTGRRYLDALKPLLNDESKHSRTGKIVVDFLKNEGAILHRELKNQDRNNKHTSYISEPWLNMYLKSRVPLPINFNPFMALSFDPKHEFNDQLTRACNLIISTLRWKRSLDSEYLTPEVVHMKPEKTDNLQFRKWCLATPKQLSWGLAALWFKAYPLDMSQHPWLFGATRIPAIGKDYLLKAKSSNHLLALRRGHLFSIQVLNENGYIFPPSEILASLRVVVDQSHQWNEDPVASLTSLPRDDWAKYRDALVEAGNVENLHTIDSALFALCLDEPMVGPSGWGSSLGGDKTETLSSGNAVDLMKSLLHGDARQRWWDKSWSLIVEGRGVSAVSFEHSWGDGVAMLRLMEDIYRDATKHHWVSSSTKCNGDVRNRIRRINLSLTPELKAGIEKAVAAHKSAAESLNFGLLRYIGLNRNLIKETRLSPDALLQLCVQLTEFKLRSGQLSNVYESCTTSAFKHGRTETMRPLTAESRKLAEQWQSADRGTRYELLKQASAKHTQLIREAYTGKGFDRHLFVMKTMVESKGDPLPAIFQDESYMLSQHHTLSTSTLSTETLALGGFGPVVQDGLGIGYNVVDRMVGASVTGYNGKRSAAQFVDCLKETLDDVCAVILQPK